MKKVITVEEENELAASLVEFVQEHELTTSLWQHLSALVIKEFQQNATIKKE
ncbi:hypothetical protein [Paucilactobacillus kaifaensis]|uniref:hypothetical protein n=1 Tax=Paucilactobacillus kaifaensis TaxID=2559921 RepID=UPI001484D408|nr:hypothetical protein [Paucilactobacillus kaifaensis]